MKIQETKVSPVNGDILRLNSRGFWVDDAGNSGYHSHFSGLWVCLSCGLLCDCGEDSAE